MPEGGGLEQPQYSEWVQVGEERDEEAYDYGVYVGEWPNGHIEWDKPPPHPPIPPAPDPPIPPGPDGPPAPPPVKRPIPPVPPIP